MPLDATAIEFRAVSYGVNSRPIVSDVSLRIASGETLVLLGRSGSGKTTLLRLINRMLVPTQGEAVVDAVVPPAWDAIRRRRHIGYVIQEGGLFPHFTVAEMSAWGRRSKGGSGRASKSAWTHCSAS